MDDYTIIIADDHTLMREGIRHIIDEEKGMKVIGEAGDGLELLGLLKKTVPDMVILDISMPGLRGIEAAQEIRAIHPEITILILSMHKNEAFLSMALEAGASGYLLKEDSGDELLTAIERIRMGDTYLSRKMTSEFPSAIISICRGDRNADADRLSPRERQVLQMIAEGFTDRQISERLFISVRTVHRHRANIRTKLNLKHTADLVRYAISQGYVSR